MSKMIVYRDGKTGSDIMAAARAIACAERKLRRNTIKVVEFDDNDCLVDDGTVFRQQSVSINVNSLVNTIAWSNPWEDGKFRFYLKILEDNLGIPAIPGAIELTLRDIPVRPIDDISDMLDGLYRRQEVRKKRVETYINVKPTNLWNNIHHKVSILQWLLSGRDLRSISYRLHTEIVRRERDMLYHIRRRPSNENMHICQDEGVLATIKILEWSLYNEWPFETCEFAYGFTSKLRR